MYFKTIILLGFLSGCLATTYQLHETVDPPEPLRSLRLDRIPIRTLPVEPVRLESVRLPRSAQGYGMSHFPVLYSPDRVHSLDVLGGYSRGNPPDYRGGIGYTFRF